MVRSVKDNGTIWCVCVCACTQYSATFPWTVAAARPASFVSDSHLSGPIYGYRLRRQNTSDNIIMFVCVCVCLCVSLLQNRITLEEMCSYWHNIRVLVVLAPQTGPHIGINISIEHPSRTHTAHLSSITFSAHNNTPSHGECECVFVPWIGFFLATLISCGENYFKHGANPSPYGSALSTACYRVELVCLPPPPPLPPLRLGV